MVSVGAIKFKLKGIEKNVVNLYGRIALHNIKNNSSTFDGLLSIVVRNAYPYRICPIQNFLWYSSLLRKYSKIGKWVNKLTYRFKLLAQERIQLWIFSPPPVLPAASLYYTRHSLTTKWTKPVQIVAIFIKSAVMYIKMQLVQRL